MTENPCNTLAVARAAAAPMPYPDAMAFQLLRGSLSSAVLNAERCAQHQPHVSNLMSAQALAYQLLLLADGARAMASRQLKELEARGLPTAGPSAPGHTVAALRARLGA